MSESENALAVSFFSEILTVEQLVRNRVSKALPKGMELSHFSVLNHLAYVAAERTPAQLAKTFHLSRGAITNTLSKLRQIGQWISNVFDHFHIDNDIKLLTCFGHGFGRCEAIINV